MLNKKIEVPIIDVHIVKAMMKEKNITVKELAEKLKVSPSSVYRFLNGGDQNFVSAESYIFLLPHALHTTLDKLLSEEFKKAEREWLSKPPDERH